MDTYFQSILFFLKKTTNNILHLSTAQKFSRFLAKIFLETMCLKIYRHKHFNTTRRGSVKDMIWIFSKLITSLLESKKYKFHG